MIHGGQEDYLEIESEMYKVYTCVFNPNHIFRCISHVLKMLCYSQTLVLEKITSGELLYEVLQKQKIERQQKRKNEMVKQRLNIKELKSNLSTGDMKGVLIYPLFFTEIDKK